MVKLEKFCSDVFFYFSWGFRIKIYTFPTVVLGFAAILGGLQSGTKFVLKHASTSVQIFEADILKDHKFYHAQTPQTSPRP